MGGGTNVTSRFFGTSLFKEFNLSLSEKLKLMNIFEKKEQVAIGVGTSKESDYSFLNEFKVNFKQGKLIDLERIEYYGEKRICCLEDFKHYWLDENGSIVHEPDTKGKLCSCDPLARALGYDSYCDEIMEEVCLEDNTEVEYKTKCKTWFVNLPQRIEKFNEVSDKMFKNCKENIEYGFCKDWINSLRDVNNEDLNSLADTILKSQNNKIKAKLKCAFPPQYILNDELKTLTAKECWYKYCIDAENWELLTINLYKKNLCHMYECNINIMNILNISDISDIKILCRNKSVVQNINEMNTILKEESKFNMFLVTKYDILFLFFLLFLFYIAFHNV